MENIKLKKRGGGGWRLEEKRIKENTSLQV